MSTISELGLRVLDRLEEKRPPDGPIFWGLSTEIYSGLVEAMNDLTILVGRPNITTNLAFTVAPNTVWQQIPSGMFLVSDIQGPSGQLRRTNLRAMDYTQASWGPDWENDTADVPKRWFPVGLTMFGVHPAPSTPINLVLSGVAYPTTSPWPYDGTQPVPFHDEFFQALELYASHYCQLKEMGAEAEEGIVLFQQYMGLAERMTTIEDRRDPLLFSRAWGAKAGIDPPTQR